MLTTHQAPCPFKQCLTACRHFSKPCLHTQAMPVHCTSSAAMSGLTSQKKEHCPHRWTKTRPGLRDVGMDDKEKGFNYCGSLLSFPWTFDVAKPGIHKNEPALSHSLCARGHPKLNKCQSIRSRFTWDPQNSPRFGGTFGFIFIWACPFFEGTFQGVVCLWVQNRPKKEGTDSRNDTPDPGDLPRVSPVACEVRRFLGHR